LENTIRIEIELSGKNTLNDLSPLDVFSFPSTSAFFIKVESVGGYDLNKYIHYVCLNTGNLYKNSALDAKIVLAGKISLKA
jgi:hypothetical protein